MSEKGIKLENVPTLPYENIEFRISERAKLHRGIRSIDHVITELSMRTQWDKQFPQGKVLEEKLASLEAHRADLLKKMSSTPPQVNAPTPRPQAQPHAQTASGFFQSLFADISCNPKDEETVWVPAEGPFMQVSDENTTAGAVSNASGNAVAFTLVVEDPDNNPWDFNAVDGFLRILWTFELPLRVFPALYDVSIDGRLSVQVESESNHFIGSRFWGGYFTGGLATPGDVIMADDSNQPIYLFRPFASDDLDYQSGDVPIARSFQSDANQTRTVFLYYLINLFCDRAIADAVGSVHASPDPAPTVPSLRCTIRPV